MNFFSWLWLLIAGHCLADTALQSSTMAKAKKPNNILENKNWAPWWIWLTHHAMIHGLVVYLLTQDIILGVTETVWHWVIDYNKGKGTYGTIFDQSLHIFWKIIFAFCLSRGL